MLFFVVVQAAAAEQRGSGEHGSGAPFCPEQGFLTCYASSSKQEGGTNLGAVFAQPLMYANALPMCHCMNHHPADQAEAGYMCDSVLYEAMITWEPWCRLLQTCQTIGEALLRTAYACKADGMHEYSPDVNRNTSSIMCRNQGNNSCALSMEELFVTTHANLSQIRESVAMVESDDYIDTLSRVDADAVSAASAPSFPPAPHHGRRHQVETMDFARLSVCMHQANVDHASLRLPMGLRQISGNGSYTSYADLFFDKCGVKFQREWVWNIYHYSGLNYASKAWQDGTKTGKALAIAIWCVDGLALLCLLLCVVRSIRKGHCFWLCIKTSAQEKTGLTAERELWAMDSSCEGAMGQGGADMGELNSHQALTTLPSTRTAAKTADSFDMET